MQLVDYKTYETKVRNRSGAQWSASRPKRVVGDRCFYCCAHMKPANGHAASERSYNGNPIGDYRDWSYEKEEILECEACGWWAYYGYVDDTCTGGDGAEPNCKSFEKIVCGVARHYELRDEAIPLEILKAWLRRHPDHLAHVNPHAFERLVTDCFKDVYGGAEVIHLGKHSNDGGIDIKLITTDKTSVLVQVKRREDLTTSEGVDTVRALNGVLFRDGLTRGMIVTTARKFTARARMEAVPALPPFDRYKVDLLAFNDVVKMLKADKRSATPSWIGLKAHLTLESAPSSDNGAKAPDGLDVASGYASSMFSSILRHDVAARPGHDGVRWLRTGHPHA